MVNHKYQLKGFGEEADWMAFSSCLSRLVQVRSIDLIAEELNEEALALWKACASVAQNVAKLYGIRHLFCDPDSNERKRLGIKTRKEIASDLGYGRVLTHDQSAEVDAVEKKYFGIREQCWLDRLREHEFNKALLIIGADHIDSFCRLLTENRLAYELLTRDWIV